MLPVLLPWDALSTRCAAHGFGDQLIGRDARAEAAHLQHFAGQEAAGAARVNAVTAVADGGRIVGEPRDRLHASLPRVCAASHGPVPVSRPRARARARSRSLV
jgi:hypothetical protein